MKAAVLALIVALVLAHPAAAGIVVAVELAGCAVLGWLIIRKTTHNPPPRWSVTT